MTFNAPLLADASDWGQWGLGPRKDISDQVSVWPVQYRGRAAMVQLTPQAAPMRALSEPTKYEDKASPTLLLTGEGVGGLLATLEQHLNGMLQAQGVNAQWRSAVLPPLMYEQAVRCKLRRAVVCKNASGEAWEPTLWRNQLLVPIVSISAYATSNGTGLTLTIEAVKCMGEVQREFAFQ